MKMLWLALLVSPAYAQFTFDYQSPVFTSGAYAGQSITGEVVLYEPALYTGIGQYYVPQSINFSVGGQSLGPLNLVQVQFQENGGVLQDFDMQLASGSTTISVSGALGENGMQGFASIYPSTCGKDNNAVCAQGSRSDTPGAWAAPAQISTASARQVSAPEVDLSSAGAWLALLCGGLAVIRGRAIVAKPL